MKKAKKKKRIGFEKRKVKEVNEKGALVWSAQGTVYSGEHAEYHTHGAQRPMS